MSNPVNAFLQGFRVVDQLETNRERRAYLRQQMRWGEEKMSRTRQMWERQDEIYERVKLDNLQREAAGVFNATLLDIHQQMDASIKLLEKNGEHEKARQAEEKWFTGPNARANWTNEAFRRIVPGRPDIAELFALAGGFDPGAGPLVKDPARPVSMLGVTNSGDMFVGVRALTGDNMPLTEGRSADPNDPVAFNPVGMATLQKAFGQYANSTDYLALSALYSTFGEAPTGNPVPDDVKRKDAVTPPSQPERRAPTPYDKARAEHAELNRRTNELIKEREALEEQLEQEVAPISGFLGTGRIRGGDIQKRIDAINEEIRGMAVTRGPDTFTEEETRSMGEPDDVSPTPLESLAGLETDRQQTLAGAASVGLAASGGVLDGYIPGSDRLRELGRPELVSNPDFDPTYVDKIDRGEVDQLAARGQAPAPEQLQMGDPDISGAEKVPPASEPQAQQIAQSFTNRPPTQRPGRSDLLKAFMMYKGGWLTAEELRRYKMTGSWAPPVEAKFHSLGNGMGLIQYGNQFVEYQHSGAKDPNALTDRQEYNYSMEILEPYFRDSEGDLNHRGQAIAAREGRRLREELGLPATQETYENYAQGVDLVNRSSVGRWQHIVGFGPGGGGRTGQADAPGKVWFVTDQDEYIYNPGALGYAAVITGNTGQRAFNDMRTAYGNMLGQVASREGWTTAGFIDQIMRFEQERGYDSREEAVEQWLAERYKQAKGSAGDDLTGYGR